MLGTSALHAASCFTCRKLLLNILRRFSNQTPHKDRTFLRRFLADSSASLAAQRQQDMTVQHASSVLRNIGRAHERENIEQKCVARYGHKLARLVDRNGT